MGYGIAPVINVQINNEDLKSKIEQNPSFEKSFDQLLDKLRSKRITIPIVNNNPIFFKTLRFYNQFAKIILDFSNTKEHILDEDYYLSSPAEVFEILISIQTLSDKLPNKVIKIGIGDISVFWADFTFNNGDLIDIKLSRETEDGDNQYIEDPSTLSSEDAFVCSKEEMMEYFS